MKELFLLIPFFFLGILTKTSSMKKSNNGVKFSDPIWRSLLQMKFSTQDNLEIFNIWEWYEQELTEEIVLSALEIIPTVT